MLRSLIEIEQHAEELQRCHTERSPVGREAGEVSALAAAMNASGDYSDVSALQRRVFKLCQSARHCLCGGKWPLAQGCPCRKVGSCLSIHLYH